MGDVIHTLPVVDFLMKKYPHVQIDWLTSKKGYGILPLIKQINKVYLLSLQSLREIRKQRYDYVIDIQGLFKSAFLSRISHGKKIVGFKNTREFADVFYDLKIDVGNLFRTDKHIVDLNIKMISSLDFENSKCISSPFSEQIENIKFLIPEIVEIDNKDVLNILNRKNKSSLKPLMLLFPSTTWKSKLWSMEYWFELMSKSSGSYNLCICGTKNDLESLNGLITNLKANEIQYENFLGKTNIKDLIYLIQNAELVLGMDSFGLHLASAIKNDFGSPDVFGIYGPTSPLRTGPYKHSANCLYLKELDCIGCRKKQCPLEHHNCMKKIVPEQVINFIQTKRIADSVEHIG